MAVVRMGMMFQMEKVVNKGILVVIMVVDHMEQTVHMLIGILLQCQLLNNPEIHLQLHLYLKLPLYNPCFLNLNFRGKEIIRRTTFKDKIKSSRFE